MTVSAQVEVKRRQLSLVAGVLFGVVSECMRWSRAYDFVAHLATENVPVEVNMPGVCRCPLLAY
jgi:hypothetical protein